MMLRATEAMFLIGWWERGNAGELVARSSTESTAEPRELRVIRRGGLACQVAGASFAALSVFPFL